MYEKGPCGFFFSVSFSNSLNMKKIPSYTFVELVKLLNNIGFVTMMNMSFSFLGLIKLTRSDHPKDELTVQAYAIPFKLVIKK